MLFTYLSGPYDDPDNGQGLRVYKSRQKAIEAKNVLFRETGVIKRVLILPDEPEPPSRKLEPDSKPPRRYNWENED